MTENIVTGKKFKILIDATQDIWDRISFWTKASDVYYDDNSTVESNKPTNTLKRNTYYQLGQIAYEFTAPSWVMLRCTTAGTTSNVLPTTYSTISSVGQSITDGGAKFVVCDVRPSSTLSSSSYEIPAMSLVNDLNSQLSINGQKIYFDVHDGKYGINTSSSRGSSTFIPFIRMRPFTAFFTSFSAGKSTIGYVSYYNDSDTTSKFEVKYPAGTLAPSLPISNNFVTITLVDSTSSTRGYLVTFNQDGYYWMPQQKIGMDFYLYDNVDRIPDSPYSSNFGGFAYRAVGETATITVSDSAANPAGAPVLFYFLDLNRLII